MDKSDVLPEITIYTDGACSPNPGPGGWGAVLLKKGEAPRELRGFGGETTNNRMELTAAVSALQALHERHSVILYTDSQYVKKGITSWIFAWQKNNWLTAGKKPVKNADLWRALLEEIEHHQITWKWVRGHALDTWNIRADELAVAARKEGAGSPPEVDKAPVDDAVIHMYTGVTCKHSSGAGAWAVILKWNDVIKIIGGGVTEMTANQLYIYAAIKGLQCLKKAYPVQIHTHSGYLRDGATTWLAGWQQRNWRTREGNEVSNREFWQELASLLQIYQVHVVLDDRENPLCHMLEAKELAREFEQAGVQ